MERMRCRELRCLWTLLAAVPSSRESSISHVIPICLRICPNPPFLCACPSRTFTRPHSGVPPYMPALPISLRYLCSYSSALLLGLLYHHAPGIEGNLGGGHPTANLLAVQTDCGVAEERKSDLWDLLAVAMTLKYAHLAFLMSR